LVIRFKEKIQEHQLVDEHYFDNIALDIPHWMLQKKRPVYVTFPGTPSPSKYGNQTQQIELLFAKAQKHLLLVILYYSRSGWG